MTHSLTRSDASWLHMEESTNRMLILALIAFEESPEPSHLVTLVQDRLLRHDRFRMRVEETARGPRWVPCDVDLSYHMERIPMLRGDTEELCEVAGELLSRPLDRTRPLWQMHIAEPYGTGCAVFIRLHHALGDGVALMEVFQSLTDDLTPAKPVRPSARPLALGWPRTLAGGARRLLELFFAPADPVTPLKGELGGKKRVAFSRAFGLHALAEKAHGEKATLNDLVLTALTTALRRYLQSRGFPPAGLCLRAVVPVDLRGVGLDELGNRFGLVFLPLPVGMEDPGKRSAAVRANMAGLKSSPESPAILALLRLVGFLPASWEQKLVRFFGTKATLVVSNLPGPREVCHLAGQAASLVLFWVPASGSLGLGVSFFSYAGQLRMAVASDDRLIPDPEVLVGMFERVMVEES